MSDQETTAQTEDDERAGWNPEPGEVAWTVEAWPHDLGANGHHYSSGCMPAADVVREFRSLADRIELDWAPEPDAIAAKPITYLLYSLRHNAYWMPNSAGYTEDVDKAGRYSEAEAVRKVVASAHCGIRTQVTCMVAAPDNWKSVA